jgi:hypothetical protein
LATWLSVWQGASTVAFDAGTFAACAGAIDTVDATTATATATSESFFNFISYELESEPSGGKFSLENEGDAAFAADPFVDQRLSLSTSFDTGQMPGLAAGYVDASVSGYSLSVFRLSSPSGLSFQFW